MKTFLSIILFLWEILQNLVGLLLVLIYHPEKSTIYHKGKYPKRIYYFTDKIPAGISLGNIVIVPTKVKPETMLHEYGHTIQSLYLGPLYLVVIGLPSLLWNRYCRTHWEKDYYSFYTEKWADKLGGVKR